MGGSIFMSQKEITKAGPLFDDNGDLILKGYAKHNFFDYNKEKLQTGALKLKEWDYYYIGSGSFGLALTIADNGYMALLSVSFLDFIHKSEITKSEMKWFTAGKTNLPRTTKSGDVSLQTKSAYLIFKNSGKGRLLKGYYENFRGKDKLEFEIKLGEEPDESITMLTPFNKPKHFYYNQKINCIPAVGSFRIGGDIYRFEEGLSSGTLDWGRGVWTYKNTWYWGSLSTRAHGVPFGFNIGYGFGDTSAASENVIFYDGKAHKFNNIDFGIPQKDGTDDFLGVWHFKSDDGRLDMTFTPLFDRASDTNAVIIRSNQHQVFGSYSGTAILDDGRRIEFKNKIGFAEKVYNKW